MAKNVIRWTEREYKELAAWFLDNQYSPEEYGMRPRLKEAQEAVLPRDRHRPMTWVDSATRRKLAQYWREMRVSPVAPQPSEPAPPLALPTLDAFSLEDLLVEVARRVARGLENVLQAPQIVHKDFAPELLPPAKHNPFMHASVKRETPELLVIGTYGPQEACLRELFTDAALRFVGSDEGAATIARKGGGVDHAFVLTKFISHAQFDHVKKLPCPYTMVNGGMTELKEKLREYLRP